jgi:hypothetical protein
MYASHTNSSTKCRRNDLPESVSDSVHKKSSGWLGTPISKPANCLQGQLWHRKNAMPLVENKK